MVGLLLLLPIPLQLEALHFGEVLPTEGLLVPPWLFDSGA